jgi:sugar lactone lactonase YvrE
LVRFGLDGATNKMGSGFANITGLAFGPDNALYACEFQADRVYCFAPPSVAAATTTIYARVTDPVRVSFAPDGTLFVGRDNTGSGGKNGDAVKIHRIGPGGSPVEEYGNVTISDPDAVFYDTTGQFSGTPGAVLVAGTQETSLLGKISKILPNGAITNLYGPAAFNFNPNLIVFDAQGGRLLITDDVGGKIWAMTNTTPGPLINLPMALPLAVDSMGRILAGANDTALRLYNAEGALLNAAFAQAQTNSVLVRGPGGFWGQDVYFIGTNWNLMRVTTDGVVSQAGTGFGGVIGFAFGPDGALYASQHNNDLIWRIAPIAPRLTATPAAPGYATISWTPDTPGFVLQETLTLAPPAWTNSPSGATNPVVVPAVLPTKFYRLRKP